MVNLREHTCQLSSAASNVTVCGLFRFVLRRTPSAALPQVPYSALRSDAHGSACWISSGHYPVQRREGDCLPNDNAALKDTKPPLSFQPLFHLPKSGKCPILRRAGRCYVFPYADQPLVTRGEHDYKAVATLVCLRALDAAAADLDTTRMNQH